MARDFYSIKAKADKTAEVWVYEQIGEDFWGDGVSAKNFTKELKALDATAIDLHINSPGGAVFDGHAIYNALKAHPAIVTTYIDGLAASIASVIALAGDKVVMADNALFMIHEPWGMAMGTADDMRKTADVLDKTRDTIVGVYQDKTRKDEQELRDAMSAETWYSASEALDAGFVDEVGAALQVAACADWKSLPFMNAPESLFAEAEAPVAEPQDGPAEDVTEEPGSEEVAETLYHPAPII